MRLTHADLSRRTSSESSSSGSISFTKDPESSPTPDVTFRSEKEVTTRSTPQIIADEESNPFLSDSSDDNPGPSTDHGTAASLNRMREMELPSEEKERLDREEEERREWEFQSTHRLDSIFPPITMSPIRSSSDRSPSPSHSSSPLQSSGVETNSHGVQENTMEPVEDGDVNDRRGETEGSTEEEEVETTTNEGEVETERNANERGAEEATSEVRTEVEEATNEREVVEETEAVRENNTAETSVQEDTNEGDREGCVTQEEITSRAEAPNQEEAPSREEERVGQMEVHQGHETPTTPPRNHSRPRSPPPIRIAHRPIIQRMIIPTNLPKRSSVPPLIFRPHSPTNPFESDAPNPSSSDPVAPRMNGSEIRFTFRGRLLQQGTGQMLDGPDSPLGKEALPPTRNSKPRTLFTGDTPNAEPSLDLGHDSIGDEEEKEERKIEEKEEDLSDAETVSLDPNSGHGRHGVSHIMTETPVRKKTKQEESSGKKKEDVEVSQEGSEDTVEEFKDKGKDKEGFLPSMGVFISDLESSVAGDGDGERGEVDEKAEAFSRTKRDRNSRSPEQLDGSPGSSKPKEKRGKVDLVQSEEQGRQAIRPRRRSARLSAATTLPTPLSTEDPGSDGSRELTPGRTGSPSHPSTRREKARETEIKDRGKMLLLSEGEDH